MFSLFEQTFLCLPFLLLFLDHEVLEPFEGGGLVALLELLEDVEEVVVLGGVRLVGVGVVAEPKPDFHVVI